MPVNELSDGTPSLFTRLWIYTHAHQRRGGHEGSAAVV